MKLFLKFFLVFLLGRDLFANDFMEIELPKGGSFFAEISFTSKKGEKVILQAKLLNKELVLDKYQYRPCNQQTKRIPAFVFTVKHSRGVDTWYLYVRRTLGSELEFYLSQGPKDFVYLKVINHTKRIFKTRSPFLSVVFREPPKKFEILSKEKLREHYRVQKVTGKIIVSYSGSFSVLYAFATGLAYLWP